MRNSAEHQPLAIITGGSRGLGRSMALHLADRGVNTIITYQANGAAAQQVCEAVGEKGATCVALPLDLSSSPDMQGFAEEVRSLLASRFERPTFDYLVNNAGHGVYASFEETTEEQLQAIMQVHFKAPFLLTQALLPSIAAGGSIWNVSSGLTRFTLPGYGLYAAVKGAVEVLSRYQAAELGSRNIRVNTLAPGAIATDFGGGAVRDNPELNRHVAASVALGRVGEADDIGAIVALLLSPAAGWLNGQRIEVSGGQSL